VLADIAIKYEVPTVKVTGGQRIDLLGIPKENLNDMWDEIASAGTFHCVDALHRYAYTHR
jgi:nitrite reductase (NADH) large subunit